MIIKKSNYMYIIVYYSNFIILYNSCYKQNTMIFKYNAIIKS